MPDRPVPHPAVFRAVMGGLGLVQTVNGLWALFAPRSFYDDFPARPRRLGLGAARLQRAPACATSAACSWPPACC